MAETAAKTNSVGGTDVGRCDELDNRRESSVDNDKREDPGNDKSRRNDVTHGQWVAMGVTTSWGPFLASVAPRRWRCQALCDSSRTAVYFCSALYSRAELALTAGRVCRDYVCTPGVRYRRVLRGRDDYFFIDAGGNSRERDECNLR